MKRKDKKVKTGGSMSNRVHPMFREVENPIRDAMSAAQNIDNKDEFERRR